MQVLGGKDTKTVLTQFTWFQVLIYKFGFSFLIANPAKLERRYSWNISLVFGQFPFPLIYLQIKIHCYKERNGSLVLVNVCIMLFILYMLLTLTKFREMGIIIYRGAWYLLFACSLTLLYPYVNLTFWFFSVLQNTNSPTIGKDTCLLYHVLVNEFHNKSDLWLERNRY